MNIAYLIDFMLQNVVGVVVLHRRYVVSHVGIIFWLIWAHPTIEGCDCIRMGKDVTWFFSDPASVLVLERVSVYTEYKNYSLGIVLKLDSNY